jgi:hypothetical protein
MTQRGISRQGAKTQRFGEGEEFWLWVYDRLGQADLSPLILPDRPNEFLFSQIQNALRLGVLA